MNLKRIPMVLLGLLLAGPLGAIEQRVWTARYALEPAGQITVENVQGNITVEGWDRAEVAVSVFKSAASPQAHLDDVGVEVEAGDHALKLRTVYPGESKEAVRVDYRLRVPRQVRLDRLRTLGGDISVRDIEGSVDARTLNGNIRQSAIRGSVVARAINGNVAVSFRALPERSQPVQLETVNGTIRVSLPPRADADLQLSTLAGRVESKYAFSVSEAPGDSALKSRVGQGGVQVRLRTVRGDIQVTENEDLL